LTILYYLTLKIIAYFLIDYICSDTNINIFPYFINIFNTYNHFKQLQTWIIIPTIKNPILIPVNKGDINVPVENLIIPIQLYLRTSNKNTMEK
jgi:hypothetical protein